MKNRLFRHELEHPRSYGLAAERLGTAKDTMSILYLPVAEFHWYRLVGLESGSQKSADRAL